MNSVIIVAAGKGSRMGPDVDKLFLEVAGAPVIAHTWAAVEAADCVANLVIVVRSGLEEAFAEIARSCGFQKPYRIVPGGKERQDSVWCGCEALPDGAEIVAIQDGARPCLTPDLLQATINDAREFGAAVAAQPMVDTVKESNDGRVIHRHLERSRLFAVQTPQTFRVDIIRRALAQVRSEGAQVTDDTAACELIGEKVRLTVRTEPNPKVTTPADLPYIDLLLRKMSHLRIKMR